VASKLGSHATAYHAEQHALAELRQSGGSFYVDGPWINFL
jgi:hypothetical protein